MRVFEVAGGEIRADLACEGVLPVIDTVMKTQTSPAAFCCSTTVNTGQARKWVLEGWARCSANGVFEVHTAPIEFTDPRYAERFSRFPMDLHAAGFLSMLVPQTLKSTGNDSHTGRGGAATTT